MIMSEDEVCDFAFIHKWIDTYWDRIVLTQYRAMCLGLQNVLETFVRGIDPITLCV